MVRLVAIPNSCRCYFATTYPEYARAPFAIDPFIKLNLWPPLSENGMVAFPGISVINTI